MKYFFIVNCRKDKVAIRQEVEQQLAELEDEIASRGDSTSVYLTTGEGDATREVRLYSDLHPNEKVCFVACGGDGTINEVASGMVGFPNKSMAVLHLHSNADFVRYYPDRDFTSIRDLIYGETQQIDILKINDSYSINVCDFGFDAIVANVANELAAEGKKNVFGKGVARAIFSGRYNRIKVVADGEPIGHRLMLLCTLANGKYVGSGMLTAPFADNQDGLIELTYLRPMSLVAFLAMIGPYSRGEHHSRKFFNHKLIYRRVKHVEVSSKHIIDLCLDGEILPGTHFNIDILPQAITIQLPQLNK